MILQQFITTYTNKAGVGDTSQNVGQCVGLIEVWTDSLGLAHTWGDAKDLPSMADRSVFDVFTSGVPLPGDIFCFDATYGAGRGHTGIVVSADTKFVTLFEQNDPEGSTPHLKQYTYAHAIGWLHPKNLTNQGTIDMIDDQGKADLVYATALHIINQASSKTIVGLSFPDALTNIQKTIEWKAQDAILNAYMPAIIQALAVNDESQILSAISNLKSQYQQYVRTHPDAPEASQAPATPQPPVSPPPATDTPPAAPDASTQADMSWLKDKVSKILSFLGIN